MLQFSSPPTARPAESRANFIDRTAGIWRPTNNSLRLIGGRRCLRCRRRIAIQPRNRIFPHWWRPGAGSLPPPFIDPLAAIITTLGGTILTDAGGTIFDDPDPCKCCNPCACPDSWCLPGCIPRTWVAIVSGVVNCPCTSVFTYPPNDVFVRGTGNVNGSYCLTYRTDLLATGSRCNFWIAPAGGTAQTAWYTFGPCPDAPIDCCNGFTDASFGTVLALFNSGGGATCEIHAFGSGNIGSRADSEFFYDITPGIALVMDGPTIFHNQVTCGIDTTGTSAFGCASGGTVMVIPCC